MTDGFLGRWSRRKQEVRAGQPLADPVPPAATPASAAVTAPAQPPANAAATPATPAAPAVAAEPPAAPTLEDASALTPASDFKPFMAQGVSTDVRNAAMKKLFTDPRFNVMDRLDIYIDDYSQPDPLPAAMLRQMASAKFLNLFDNAEQAGTQAASAPAPGAAAPQAGDDADTPPVQDVAQSGVVPALSSPHASAIVHGPAETPTETQDAHTDLRLQPDPAAQLESAGPGPA